jgi:hypothetical protein
LLGLSLLLEELLASASALARKAQKKLGVAFVFSDGAVPRGGFEMEHRLAAYVANGVAQGRGHRIWSISTDEGMVKGLNLQNSIIGLPNNLIILACPQVDSAFELLGVGWAAGRK